MTSIVYRKIPAVPHHQYVRGVVDGRLFLWHRDRAIAKRMDDRQAVQVAHVLRARSTGYGGQQGVTEPPGEYGVEQV